MADQFVASRDSKYTLLQNIADAAELYSSINTAGKTTESDCGDFIAVIENTMTEVVRHDHYMGCTKRQMSVTLNNDMAEVNQYIMAAQRRRKK